MNQLDFETIKPILEANDVEFAAVFGSYARGEQRPDSDVDLLIRFSKPKGLFAFAGLQNKLSEVLKTKVDLVTERALSPYIKDTVLSQLKTIYGR